MARAVTDLELFQAERIKALEAEVLKLQNQIALSARQYNSRKERVIQLIHDPAFQQPIHNVVYK